MELTKITLTDGTAHIVSHSPQEVYETVTHSDGKPKNLMHLFKLENREEIYINATYIQSIEKVESHMSENHAVNKQSENKDDSERIKENLEASKKFKEDLDGNME
ncbi:hypothetical protein [Alkalibacterium kapii]|uniref:Uncharacterized protein n=1 Tax=Alkalibacterium kapii TaxID=426704 RepID=A0A511AR14_9LACT|nr:hypothetical protein [Alkalibacterium kapii]GEK90639.1 hypothetical protein AKA01nite_02610 [Alkalibacterium kapii]